MRNVLGLAVSNIGLRMMIEEARVCTIDGELYSEITSGVVA